MNVGMRITELRTAFGLSQYALWKRTGIAQGSLSQYEAGLKTPGIDTLERICQGFGITLSDFFQEDEINKQFISLSAQEMEIISCFRALNDSRKKDVASVLHLLANTGNDDSTFP